MRVNQRSRRAIKAIEDQAILDLLSQETYREDYVDLEPEQATIVHDAAFGIPTLNYNY